MGRVADHFKRHMAAYNTVAAFALFLGGYTLAAIPASHKIAALEEEARMDNQVLSTQRKDLIQAHRDGYNRTIAALKLGAQWSRQEVRRCDMAMSGLYGRIDDLTFQLGRATRDPSDRPAKGRRP